MREERRICNRCKKIVQHLATTQGMKSGEIMFQVELTTLLSTSFRFHGNICCGFGDD